MEFELGLEEQINSEKVERKAEEIARIRLSHMNLDCIPWKLFLNKHYK